MIKNHNLSINNLLSTFHKSSISKSLDYYYHKVARNFLIFLILDVVMVLLLLFCGFINLDLLYK